MKSKTLDTFLTIVAAATLVIGAVGPASASAPQADDALAAVASVNGETLSLPVSAGVGADLVLETASVASGGTLTVAIADPVEAAMQATTRTTQLISSEQEAEVSYVVETGASTGGAIYSILASPTAQTSFAYDFSSDAGSVSLVLDEDTGTVAVVNADGITENVVLPAWARDAEGNSVESSYRTEGSTLIQDVVLTGAEVFPVVADPELACDALFCTVEFNKAETDDAVRYTASDAALPGASASC